VKTADQKLFVNFQVSYAVQPYWFANMMVLQTSWNIREIVCLRPRIT